MTKARRRKRAISTGPRQQKLIGPHAEVGAVVRAHRRALGINTLPKFRLLMAEHGVETTNATLSRIEAGLLAVPLEWVEQLAAALRVSTKILRPDVAHKFKSEAAA